MPFFCDYACQILVMTVEIVRQRVEVSRALKFSVYKVLFGFIFNFLEGFFYHLLRVASRDKACFEICNILFNVNRTINLT